MIPDVFRKLIWNFYEKYSRSFPWRETKDPYHILVSEMMLQQTQTDRVLPKYTLFLKQFPTLSSLAKAKRTDVLRAWQGLGYNRRALYLHKSAQTILKEFDGIVPQDTPTLLTLPGVGAYTAAAIQTFAFEKPAILIETNIRTVFIYHFFKKKDSVHDNLIRERITQTLDAENPREWYWALMDYGVFLKKKNIKINSKSAHYTKQSRFEGSRRQIRGRVLRILLDNRYMTYKQLQKSINIHTKRLGNVLDQLISEGFLTKNKNRYTLAS